jgi:hypothetical protein
MEYDYLERVQMGTERKRSAEIDACMFLSMHSRHAVDPQQMTAGLPASGSNWMVLSAFVSSVKWIIVAQTYDINTAKKPQMSI